MFEKAKAFFRNLFGGSDGKETENLKENVAFLVQMKEEVPYPFRVFVFDGTRFLGALADLSDHEIRDGLTCWAFLEGAVDVRLTMPFKNGLVLETHAPIHLLPSAGLGAFLAGRTQLTRGELASWVQGRFERFAEMVRTPKENFISLEAEARTQLAANFTLLLSGTGIECRNFSAFSPVDAVPDVKSEEIDEELKAEVEKVNTPEDWRNFVSEVQTAGMPMTSETLGKWNGLGESLLGKTISSQECVAGIRKLAEDAAQEIQVNESYWNPLSLRLRLGLDAGGNEADGPEVQRDAFQVDVPKSRRPKKGFFFTDYVELDQDLRAFIRTKIQTAAIQMESAQRRAKNVRLATELRLMRMSLAETLEILERVPMLDSNTRALRVEKDDLKRLAQVLDQAVTAAEYLEAALNAKDVFRGETVPEELEDAVEMLRKKITERCTIR